MEEVTIRRAQASDLDRIMEIFAAARRFMAATGNACQWMNGYPQRELMAGEIAAGHCHVCVTTEGSVAATFCLLPGPDPTYDRIEDGSWPDDGPYHVIHRLASDSSAHGIGRTCIEWCAARCGRLRLDTHRDNRVMQSLAGRCGFVRCGIIHVADGTPRIAYQRTGTAFAEEDGPASQPEKETTHHDMKIKHIIFDFDGTLMDTAPIILATMAATIREMGLPGRTEEECRATIGKRLEDIPAMLFPGVQGLADVYAATYLRIFPQENRPGVARPFPGVADTLRRLNEQGYTMAVASSRNRGSLLDFIDGMGLTDTFRMIVSGEDVREAKPAPEPVLAICGAMGWRPEETLVVGDATYDILMGHNAGSPTCAVTYGNHSRDRLLTAAPDFVIDSFPKLEACLGGKHVTDNNEQHNIRQ